MPPLVLTVTAALRLTVNVTTLPAFRSPPPLAIPVPEVAIEAIFVVDPAGALPKT
jgi:hypothetical protein